MAESHEHETWNANTLRDGMPDDIARAIIAMGRQYDVLGIWQMDSPAEIVAELLRFLAAHT